MQITVSVLRFVPRCVQALDMKKCFTHSDRWSWPLIWICWCAVPRHFFCLSEAGVILNFHPWNTSFRWWDMRKTRRFWGKVVWVKKESTLDKHPRPVSRLRSLGTTDLTLKCLAFVFVCVCVNPASKWMWIEVNQGLEKNKKTGGRMVFFPRNGSLESEQNFKFFCCHFELEGIGFDSWCESQRVSLSKTFYWRKPSFCQDFCRTAWWQCELVDVSL